MKTFSIIIKFINLIVILMINLEPILLLIKIIGHIVGNHVPKVILISQVHRVQIKIQAKK